MPLKTFLNLSEEKRNKVINAAIKEFSSVPYEKISINQIIKDAEISRGSFYMYFEDKIDLTLYLLDMTKQQLMKDVVIVNQKAQGNLPGFVLGLHDILYDYYRQDEYRNFFKNLLIYFQGRPEPELRAMKDIMPENRDLAILANMINKEQFAVKDDALVRDTLEISLLLLRNVIFKSFRLNLSKESSAELLQNYLKILQYGYGGKTNA